MSAPKHTPGPWHVNMIGGREPQIWAGRNLCVAKVNMGLPAHHDANARLAAAAPEMLEALKAARMIVEDSVGHDLYVAGHIDSLLAKIDAALAKAEGRS